MRNARVYDNRVTIGGVPSTEDLKQLKRIGYRTLVDLRDEPEKFTGHVERTATELGLRYRSIPVTRDAIRVDDVRQFYDAIFEKGSAPLYAFSRYGKKPLAFLLLLEAAAHQEPIFKIFRKASRFGLPLDGDLCLQEFLVRFINSPELGALLQSVQQHRPDLLDGIIVIEGEGPVAPGAAPTTETITEALAEALTDWQERREPCALRRRLEEVLKVVEAGSP